MPSGYTCLLGGSLKFANFFLLWGPDIGDRLQSRDKRQLRVSYIHQVDAVGLKLNQLIVSQSPVYIVFMFEWKPKIILPEKKITICY